MKMQVLFPAVLMLHGRLLHGQDLTGTNGWRDKPQTFAGTPNLETNSDPSIK